MWKRKLFKRKNKRSQRVNVNNVNNRAPKTWNILFCWRVLSAFPSLLRIGHSMLQFFFIPYRTRVNWIEKSKAKKYVLDKKPMQFFFLSFICLEFGICAFSLLPNNGYTNQPNNQPNAQKYEDVKRTLIHAYVWLLYLCNDCLCNIFIESESRCYSLSWY